jgi:membrane protease YdiL (CAAX protease family)
LTPLIAVLTVCQITRGEKGVRQLFQKFRWKGFSHKWFFLSTWSFSIIGITAILLRFLYDGFFPPFKDFGPIKEILLYSVPLFLFPGITEEFAWRGFLQSRLQQKFKATYACVIVGVVWGCWHYPDFLLENWNTSIGSQVGFFFITVGASIIIGWLFRQTGETVFIAMLAHFGANIVFTFSPIFNIYEDGSRMTITLYIVLVWVAVLLIIARFGLDLKKEKIAEKAHLSRL